MYTRVRHRIAAGVGANAFGQVVTIAGQLAGVPVFLYVWGSHVYGEWLLITSIPAYLGVSDLGFASVAGTEMTMQVARGNRAGALESFQSSWMLITCMSLVVGITMLTCAEVLPLARWLRLRAISGDQLPWIVVAFSVYVLLGLQTILAIAGFRAIGDYAAGTFYGSLARAAEFGGIIGSVALGARPATAALVLVLVRGALLLLIVAILLRRAAWLRYGWGCARMATVKRLVAPAVAFMVLPLSNALGLQGMVTVVGVLLGPVAVVTFSTSRTVSRAAFQIMGTINNAVSPEVSSAFGVSDIKLVRLLHREACRTALWSGLLGTLALSVCGETIVRVWTGGRVPLDAQLFHILLLVILANALWYTSSVVLMATNTHQQMAVVYLAGTVLSLMAAYLLVPRIALSGGGIALLATDALMVGYVVPRAIALTEDAGTDFWGAVVRPPVPARVARWLIPKPRWA